MTEKPDGRFTMNTFESVSVWGALGSIVVGTLGFVVFHALLAEPDPVRAGETLEALAEIVMILCAATIGFVLGGIYGAVRARKAPILNVIAWSLAGTLLGGILTGGFLLCVGNSEVVLLSLYGAMFGFVVGAIYGIRRSGHKIPPLGAADHQA